MSKIRNSIKAIIVRDGALLVTKNRDDDGVFYLLPGGGQRHGETMEEALARECREEIGVKVKMFDIVYIREYRGRNHEFAEHDSWVHQIEFMFRCEIADDAEPSNGTEPDSFQEGVLWVPLEELAEYRLYPAVLKEVLNGKEGQEGQRYLGDVN